MKNLHRFIAAAVAAAILPAQFAAAAPEHRGTAHFSAPRGGFIGRGRAGPTGFAPAWGARTHDGYAAPSFSRSATRYGGVHGFDARPVVRGAERGGNWQRAGFAGGRDRFLGVSDGRDAWNWRSAWGYGGGWSGGWGGYWDPGWGLDAGWAWGGIGLGLGIGLIVAPPLFVLPPPIYAAPPPVLLGMPAIAPPAFAGTVAQTSPQAASLPPPAQVLPQAPAAMVGAAVPPPIVVMPPPPIMVAAAAPPLIFAPPAFAFGIAPPFLAFAPIAPIFWTGGFITGGYIASAFYGGFWDPGFRVGYGGGFGGAYGWHGTPRGGVGYRGAAIHNVAFHGSALRGNGLRERGFGRGPVAHFGAYGLRAPGRGGFAHGHFGGERGRRF